MKSGRPVWNWSRLILLGGASSLAMDGFGFGFPIFGSYSTDSPAPPGYPWSVGLIFTVLFAFVFLLCLDNPHQRRAAFAAFGITALLTGPAYVWTGERLARFALASSPWAAPHLPPGLLVLCWGGSAALLVWGLRRSTSQVSQNGEAGLLFSGLLLILLVMPLVSNLCGVESLRIATAMPASADAFRQNEKTLDHFLVQGEAGSVGDSCGFLAQWVALAVSALVLLFVGLAGCAGWLKRETPDTAARPFPSRTDLIPLLLFSMGGLIFVLVMTTLTNFSHQIVEVEQTMERHVYPHHAGILTVEMMAGLAFLTGSGLVLRRMQTAFQMRFGFTLLLLVASALLSILAIGVTHHAMRIVGGLPLVLCALQIITFCLPKGRARWTSGTFVSPSETALSFAVQGSVLFAVLASALIAIAIELAFLSVFAIKYFIMWGNALKPLHGVAPTEKIVPMIAPELPRMTISLGPVYLAFCVVIGVATVLLFSLVYWGVQSGAALVGKVRALKYSHETPAPTTFVERGLGAARV
jgi:hypothetical protein